MLRSIKALILKKVFLSAYRPGTYYSTIPDLNDVRSRSGEIFVKRLPSELGEINLDRDQMESFLAASAGLIAEFDFTEHPAQGRRYYTGNTFFNKADGLALYVMMRTFRPRRIIEVGSGFSSALMLDIRDRFFDKEALSLHFIEPYPDRLHSLLSGADHAGSRITREIVQHVSLDEFRQLEENDILFIDSSHVSKIGSDLNYLLFEVLPVLRPGVIIHFHDIFYPFEYPREWVEQGIAWNEAYLLRAFLMNNDRYRVVMFNSYVGHDPALRERWADMMTGGSIYLRKLH